MWKVFIPVTYMHSLSCLSKHFPVFTFQCNTEALSTVAIRRCVFQLHTNTILGIISVNVLCSMRSQTFILGTVSKKIHYMETSNSCHPEASSVVYPLSSCMYKLLLPKFFYSLGKGCYLFRNIPLKVISSQHQRLEPIGLLHPRKRKHHLQSSSSLLRTFLAPPASFLFLKATGPLLLEPKDVTVFSLNFTLGSSEIIGMAKVS